ncbi:hypothetical protein GOODEAATRI_024757, partial [Goodea atripinnis]
MLSIISFPFILSVESRGNEEPEEGGSHKQEVFTRIIMFLLVSHSLSLTSLSVFPVLIILSASILSQTSALFSIYLNLMTDSSVSSICLLMVSPYSHKTHTTHTL